MRGGMKWIGITGRAGAGKDHLYRELLRFDPRFVRISFADGLRQEIYEHLGHRIEKPYSELERNLQQWWGTEYRREQDEDYWVKLAESAARNGGGFPVFTDVRFPNEARMIIRNGGLIVRVMAPPEVRERRLGVLPPEHDSETAMDDWDADVHVTSTEENLAYEGQVARVVSLASWKDESYFLDRIRESLESRG